jgi:hypothetical protein
MFAVLVLAVGIWGKQQTKEMCGQPLKHRKTEDSLPMID